MAIVKLGSLVVGIRGTVGGNTFSANKNGPYVKSWGRGANPRSAAQQGVRGRMTTLGPLWQSLSGAQRAAWDALAVADPEPHFNSLGESVVLSGWGYFVMLNARRLQFGTVAYDDAPVGTQATRPSAVAINMASIEPGVPTAGWTWTKAGMLVDDRATIFCAVSPGVRSALSEAGRVWMAAAPGDTSSYIFGSPFVLSFGEVPGGWRFRLWQYIQRDSGLRSLVQTFDGFITP